MKPNNRDFLMSLAQFHHVTQELLDLLSLISEERANLPDVCGTFSVRQFAASLSGWLAEADRFFLAHDREPDAPGIETNPFQRYHVALRSSLNWATTIAEFRRLRHDLIKHAVAVDAQQFTADPRYTEWLLALCARCQRQLPALRAFVLADEDGSSAV